MSENAKYDLLIKGGHVIDPANNVDAVMDVAIKDGKIAAVDTNIPVATAAKVVEAEGTLVTPGLIDIHAHHYPLLPTHDDGITLTTVDAEAHCITSGVTTVVDAGTTGPRDFLDFKQNVIDKCPVRVLALINIAKDGMVYLPSEQNPNEFLPELCAEYVKSFPETLVGIKTAHYWTGKPYDELHTPWASVDATLKAGELAGVLCMFDFAPHGPERTYEQLVMNKMRPGDIHTHVYASHIPTIDENGKVYDYMFKSRERGCLFDLGHGAGSFWWRNAAPAWEQGFYPDTISTDLHMHNIHGSVLSMIHTMSKYLSLGMPLNELIMRSTCYPAKVINRPELGTLSVGAGADVALLEMHTGKYGYTDCGNAKISGDKKLTCAMTIRDGKILYDLHGLSMVDWKDAPKNYKRL